MKDHHLIPNTLEKLSCLFWAVATLVSKHKPLRIQKPRNQRNQLPARWDILNPRFTKHPHQRTNLLRRSTMLQR